MNILILLKKYSVMIVVGVISILWAIISSLRLDKAKTQRDLAQGEAKAVRKAVKAQQDSTQLTSEKIEEGNEKRRNSDFSDIS